MRKAVFLVLLMLLLGGIAYFLMSDSKGTEKTSAVVATQNDLPDIELVTLKGDLLRAKDIKGKTVFVLFQPDCDHCQREAVDFREHLHEFKDYTLYFISSTSTDEISKFSQEYHLDNKPNVVFARAEVNQVINNYGPISAPSVYIYSEKGQLVMSFNGETVVEVILKYI